MLSRLTNLKTASLFQLEKNLNQLIFKDTVKYLSFNKFKPSRLIYLKLCKIFLNQKPNYVSSICVIKGE